MKSEYLVEHPIIRRPINGIEKQIGKNDLSQLKVGSKIIFPHIVRFGLPTHDGYERPMSAQNHD